MNRLYNSDVKAIRDHIIVADMDFGEQVTKGGIIRLDDDGKDTGIRPRWGKVYSVGPEQEDVKVGEWVLVKHGRWTRGMELIKNDKKMVLRRIDNNDILIVSDEPIKEY